MKRAKAAVLCPRAGISESTEFIAPLNMYFNHFCRPEVMIMQGPHPFLPNLDDEIVKEMLKRVGASSVSDLFSDIPPEFALGRKLAIPEGKPEATVRREVGRRLSQNVTPPQALCFLGGGVWPHYIPAAVESIVSRQELDRKSTRLNSSHLGISYAV